MKLVAAWCRCDSVVPHGQVGYKSKAPRPHDRGDCLHDSAICCRFCCAGKPGRAWSSTSSSQALCRPVNNSCLARQPSPLMHAGELQASPSERAAVAALETPRDAVRPAPKPKPGAGRARRRPARAGEQPAKPAVKPGRRQK